MFCEKCGSKIIEGNKFCIKCGNPVIKEAPPGHVVSGPFVQNEAPPRKGRARKITAITVITVILVLAVGGIFFWIWYNNYRNDGESSKAGKYGGYDNLAGDEIPEDDFYKKDSTGSDPEDTESDLEDVPGGIDNTKPGGDFPDNSAVNKNTPVQEDETHLAFLHAWGIDENTVENYRNNIYPEEYLDYSSDDEEFYFSYPAHLFNDVSINYLEDGGYGEPIEEITFTGSAYSVLTFGRYRADRTESVKGATERINNLEHLLYSEVDEVVVRADDDMGRIILTGVVDAEDQFRFYEVIKVEKDRVYRMFFQKPYFTNEEEQKLYKYVTENMYRMCGFSGSSKKVRSYQEFLESGD